MRRPGTKRDIRKEADDMILGSWAYILVVVFLALLMPAALITTREELRRVRLRVVEELQATFFKSQPNLPQLALVAARYRGGSDDLTTSDPNETGTGRQRRTQHARVKILGGASFFFLVCFLGFLLLMMPTSMLLSTNPSFPQLTYSLFWVTGAQPNGNGLEQAVGIAGAAFLGGYVFQLRYLVRATLNQELSALAFVRASLHIVQGIIVAVVAFRALGVGLVDIAPGSNVGYGGSLGLAFLIGYWPNMGLMRIAKFVRAKTKQIDEAAMELAKLIPLEVIEGIDAETAARLEEANLYDVQNLAAANPIGLYAETPFGLLEIFDWILQAQLCVNVGVPGYGDLKGHGVRTIFDLERAALAAGAPDSYVRAIGGVIFRHANSDFRAQLGLPAASAPDAAPSPAELDPAVVRHAVAIMVDDLHIHRLRALWRAMIESTSGVKDGQPPWLYATGPLPGENYPLAPAPAPTV